MTTNLTAFEVLEECLTHIFPWHRCEARGSNTIWFDLGNRLHVKGTLHRGVLGLMLVDQLDPDFRSRLRDEGVLKVPHALSHLEPHIIGWLSLARDQYNKVTFRDRDQGDVFDIKGRRFTKVSPTGLHEPTMLRPMQNQRELLTQLRSVIFVRGTKTQGPFLWVWHDAQGEQKDDLYVTAQDAVKAWARK
jgi:hypothetical protein